MNIGENIKYGRKLRRISQEEFAKLLNVSSNSISNWERGVSEPVLSALVKISRIFSISIDDLLTKDLEREGFSTEKGMDLNAVNLNYHNVLVKRDHFKTYCDLTNADDLTRVVVPGVTGKARTFEVVSDEMAPLLMFGDYVVCLPVPVEKQRELSPGRIFVVVTEKSEIIMQYCQSYKEGLKVFPHNLAGYTWQVIPYSQIFEVWEVYLRISKHFLLPYVISEIAPQLANEPKARV